MSTWRTVRVFISSTFRDMHAERDHLVKVVFPALRERLVKYRVHLVDIDLRWGVTREQAENDQVTELCLKLAGECEVFLGLLGERYGWVPDEKRGVSLTELEMLQGVLDPRSQRKPALFCLRDSSCVSAIPEPQRSEVFIETAASRIGRLADLKERVRRSGFRVMDPYPARWDADAYDRPSKSRGRLVDLKAFGERVCEDLWHAIREALQLPDTPSPETLADPLAEEADYHERFMESRLRVYVGREQVQRSLFAFAEGDEPVACLVTGPSGSGKSAALARFVTEYRQAHPQTRVVAHFVGASPRSTSLRDMLRRFCLVLKDRFSLADEVPEETARLTVTFREFLGQVPPDEPVLLVIDALNQLDETDRAQQLEWLPARLPTHVKVVVSCIHPVGRVSNPSLPSDGLETRPTEEKSEPVLEAFRHRPHRSVPVEPLRDEERREIIKQVPSLSAKTLDDQQINLLLSNPATANPLFLLVALEELRGFGSFEQLNDRITALPREGDTVTALFTQVIERLEADFDAAVVRSVLTLLASARRGLSDRELLDLVEGPSVPITVSRSDLFPVLRQLRPYLMSRADLNDFYHRNLFKAVRQRYFDTPEKERPAHAQLADYFHGQDFWHESLEEQRARARRFPPTPRPANQRKVDELPWQRLKARQGDESFRLLSDFSFLEAKTEAGQVFELVGDFAEALRVLPREYPRFHTVELLEEALRRDIHFLVRHPTTLFQGLWNSCWWYDCPEAARHYAEGTESEMEVEPGLHKLLEEWRALKEEATPGFVWLRCRRPPPLPLKAGLIAVLVDGPAGVRDLALSPNDQRFAAALSDDSLCIGDTSQGEQLRHFAGLRDIRCVAWSPDGNRIAAGYWDQEERREVVRIWDAVTSTGVARILTGSGANAVGFIRGGTHLAVALVSERAKRISEVRLGSAGAITAVLGGLVGPQESAVKIWNLTVVESVALLGQAPFGVCDLAVSPDGLAVAAVYDRGLFIGRGTFFRYDPSCEDEAACWNERELNAEGITHGFLRIIFSPDGLQLATLDCNGMIHCWATTLDGTPIVPTVQPRFINTREAQRAMAWTRDGRQVITGSEFGTLRFWDVAAGLETCSIRGHIEKVTRIAATRDGRRFVTGSTDGTVCLWNLDRVREGCTRRMSSVVGGLALHPGGDVLACISTRQSIQIWDLVRGTSVRSLGQADSYADRLAFTPSGDRLVAVSEGGVRSWEWPGGRESTCQADPEGQNHRLVFSLSRDGRMAVTACKDRSLVVWDLAAGRQTIRCVGHTGEPLCAAFSPDGRRIASGGTDGTVRLWEAASGRLLVDYRNSVTPVCALTFTSDGRRLVSGDAQGTVRVWDGTGGHGLWASLRYVWARACYISGGAPPKGQELGCLCGHTQGVREVAVSWDGQWIVSREERQAGLPRTMRLWNLNNGHCSDVIDGDGDAQGIADWFRRALVRRNEVVIQFGPTGEELAWFPARCTEVVTLGDGRSWAAVEGDHLYMLVLEGGDHS